MIPLTLLTGFLGAGKTTMLAHLLRARMARGGTDKLAVVVNEFAELGLDAVQVPRGAHALFELNRGSIFCICLRTDFIALLERIVRELNPDEIWVEATGIADVEEVFKMISVPALRTAVYLRTNICLVDPHSIHKILVTLRAAAQQVARADALVINKTDTCDAAALAETARVLRMHNAHAPVLRAQFGAVDLREIPSFDVPRLDPRPFGGHPPQPVASVTVCEDWTLDAAKLASWLRREQGSIWRAKGRMRAPDGMHWVDATLHDVVVKPCGELELPAPTALAFVGPELSRERIRADVAACRAD